MAKAKTYTIERGRDSGTGRFVTIPYALKHPTKTEVETIHIKKKG